MEQFMTTTNRNEDNEVFYLQLGLIAAVLVSIGVLINLGLTSLTLSKYYLAQQKDI
jgi:hypothetical protein